MQSYPSQKARDSGVIPGLLHDSEWEADPAQGSTRPSERLSEGLHRGGAYGRASQSHPLEEGLPWHPSQGG